MFFVVGVESHISLEASTPSAARHEGTIQDIALSSDESLLASGGSDGYVHTWDRQDGELIQAIPVGSPVTLVEFIGDDHLVVVPQDLPARVMTISKPELINLARSAVTRGFAEDECATYRIDPCPTLEEMRSSSA